MNAGRRRAFTLIELVVVMSLIVLFAGVIGFAFMRGGNSTVGLQAAQSTISGLLTLARSQAATSGRNAAVFVNVNSGNTERYLRYIVPVLRNEADTAWVPLTNGEFLPPGVYVVPSTVPSGSEIISGESWTGLNSTALGTSISQALVSTTSESWRGVFFTSRGTTTNAGNVVLANGRPNPPSASPPFVYVSPTNVRGVSVSSYGLTRLVNEAAGF